MGLQEVGCWGKTGSINLRTGPVRGTCEYGNEPSGSKKCGEVLDLL